MIDPSIPLSGRPMAPIESPLRSYLQVQENTRQNQEQADLSKLRQAQLDDYAAQAKLRDEDALAKAHDAAELQRFHDVFTKATIANSTPNPDGSYTVNHSAVAQAVTAAGFPEKAQTYLTNAATLEKSYGEIRDQQKKFQDQQHDQYAAIARLANDPYHGLQAITQAATAGLIKPEEAMQKTMQIAKNPLAWNEIRQQIIGTSPSGMAEAKARREALNKPMDIAPGHQVVDLSGGGESGQPPTVLASGAPEKKDEWASFQDAFAKGKGFANWNAVPPPLQIQALGQFAEAKADPAIRAITLQLKDIQAGQQPTKEDAQQFAKQLVNHKLAPSQVSLFGGFGQAGAAFKRMIGTEALKLDPDFDWEQSQADYDFSKSPTFQNTIRFMDAAANSLPMLVKNAEALDNGNVRAINALIQAGNNQVNNIDLKKFKTDALLIGDEVAKVLQGGGTGSGVSDAKLKQAQDVFSTSDSPKAIAAAAREVQQIFANRRSTLTRGTYLERQQQTGGTEELPPPSHFANMAPGTYDVPKSDGSGTVRVTWDGKTVKAGG